VPAPCCKKLNEADATGKELVLSIDCLDERSNGPSTKIFAAGTGLTVNTKYKIIHTMNSPTAPSIYMFITIIVAIN